MASVATDDWGYQDTVKGRSLATTHPAAINVTSQYTRNTTDNNYCNRISAFNSINQPAQNNIYIRISKNHNSHISLRSQYFRTVCIFSYSFCKHIFTTGNGIAVNPHMHYTPTSAYRISLTLQNRRKSKSEIRMKKYAVFAKFIIIADK